MMEAMRIGIDIRCLSEGRRTGVEEYTRNLLHNVFSLDQDNEYVLFLNAFNEPKGDFSEFLAYPNVALKRSRIPNKLLNFCFWYFGWPKVDRMLGGADLFFMPNINFIALSGKARLVLTVHDLSFEIYPETFSLKRRLWHFFINPKKLCRRADAVVAVSESTRADVISRYGIEGEKVHRIYSGASDDFVQLDRNDERLFAAREKYHLPFNFIFYLGTIEPRKNIPSVIRAFDRLKSLGHPQLDRYKLVMAGAKGWKSKGIFDEMRSAKHTDDIIYTDRITNEDKPFVYNLASVFVYPSFFEGFGLPVLEAMKCRVPVIVSNASALPEVVGDAGIMVDPDKPDELFLALKEVLLDRALAESLKEKEWRRAFRFHWRRTAAELLEVMKKIS